MIVVMKMQRYQFKKAKGKPLYIQLYQYLKNQIMDGYLAYQEKLLSIRTCAKQYQLSQTSVLKAYEKLMEEGWIQTKQKSGYYVCINHQQLQLRQTIQHQQHQNKHYEIKYDLRSHSVGHASFDKDIWIKCIKDALESKSMDTYGDAQGELPLRIALQKHAYEMRNVLCDIDKMVIGASVQSLLYILAGLIPSHYTIAIEEDAFPQAQFVFEQYGFQLLVLKRMKSGLDIEALYRHKPNVLYVNVNSCGTSYQELSDHEKQKLIQWANDTNALMIEDDHNGELNYRHESSASIQGNLSERVCYIGSFSRILLPSIRISYMLLPKDIYYIYQTNHKKYGPTSSKVEQLALSEYIIQGHMKRHIKRLKKEYELKSKQLEQYLYFYFPMCKIQLKEASLAYLITFPYPIKIEPMIQETKRHHIEIEGNQNTIVFGFASIEIEKMEVIVKELVKFCKKYTGNI